MQAFIFGQVSASGKISAITNGGNIRDILTKKVAAGRADSPNAIAYCYGQASAQKQQAKINSTRDDSVMVIAITVEDGMLIF